MFSFSFFSNSALRFCLRLFAFSVTISCGVFGLDKTVFLKKTNFSSSIFCFCCSFGFIGQTVTGFFASCTEASSILPSNKSFAD